MEGEVENTQRNDKGGAVKVRLKQEVGRSLIYVQVRTK